MCTGFQVLIFFLLQSNNPINLTYNLHNGAGLLPKVYFNPMVYKLATLGTHFQQISYPTHAKEAGPEQTNPNTRNGGFFVLYSKPQGPFHRIRIAYSCATNLVQRLCHHHYQFKKKTKVQWTLVQLISCIPKEFSVDLDALS